MSELMFTKYKKSDERTRVLLLYLVLNGYDLSKVEVVSEVAEKNFFGVEYQRIFGATSEFVNIPQIESDLAQIKVPVVCSPLSYETYSTAEKIYSYTAREKEKPLYINDMGVISPYMIITENRIVSSNIAENVESADKKGFMYFVEYVLKGRFTLGNWDVEYNENEFVIYYTTEKNGEKRKELLYRALELDQTSTFKLVLYLIDKAVEKIDEFPPDNFNQETYILERK